MDETRRLPGRVYQAVRDPELLHIGERGTADFEAGSPVSEDDSALFSEERLQEVKVAARASPASRMNADTALSARAVCQILREVIFGRCGITKVGQASWDEIYAGHFHVDADGWRISIYNDCDTLYYCEECVSPDGRRWSFDPGDRFGTDPIALLSTWEHRTLEQMLKEL